MEIPDEVKHLVDRLGEALVRVLVNDEESHALAQQIQDAGFEVSLSVEAALSPREDGEGQDPLLDWSDADRAFLQTFRIKLD